MRDRGVEHLSPHAAQTYDAVWTITLALKELMERQKTLTNNGTKSTTMDQAPYVSSYEDEAAKVALIDIMSDVKFTGVSV